MAETRNPYKLSDKAIDILNKRAANRFEKTQSDLSIKGFDELNVIKQVKLLYKNLEADNEEIFLELAEEQYKETNPKGKKPKLAWLLALLALTDPVSKYIYSKEVPRKRDRTTEAINASGAKVTELKRGLRYWSQMTGHYADVVTDEATLKAYKDQGIKKIRWITMGDEKVCEICRERNRKIYPIRSIPPKPHYGCRCWYEPVK